MHAPAAGVAGAGVAPAAPGVGDAVELEQAEATSATTEIRAAILRLLNICPFLLVEWMRIAIRQATVLRFELPDLLSAFYRSSIPVTNRMDRPGPELYRCLTLAPGRVPMAAAPSDSQPSRWIRRRVSLGTRAVPPTMGGTIGHDIAEMLIAFGRDRVNSHVARLARAPVWVHTYVAYACFTSQDRPVGWAVRPRAEGDAFASPMS